ncbi:hypothetical protein D3C73_1564460 [compost metagenome]
MALGIFLRSKLQGTVAIPDSVNETDFESKGYMSLRPVRNLVQVAQLSIGFQLRSSLVQTESA